MGRICTICHNEHKKEYEQWFNDGNTNVMDIYRKAKLMHNNAISYGSFAEHFKNHVKLPKYLEREIDDERKRLYSKILKQDLTIAEQLMNNLELCSNKIKAFADKEGMTDTDERLLISYLGETRLLTEEILKWKDKIEWQEPEDVKAMEDRVLEIFKEINIPIEYSVKFRDKWVEKNAKPESNTR